ncbi:hypothetical protein K469DRAFT_701666 [Zopfia rhizophila CBS 207.26]|uniref:Uncharacterized protein n=1 Tax=Zopfia rhizophila CBS 207.26 TaxID=1314779 RepID=A0A6A6DBE8_9PEZI|nr:hypothetical protein K469DRAFT_701666 [Zopfia rhizophila CBS 207.26]
MNGMWFESRTKAVSLAEDDPGIFSPYLNLIHMNQLPTKIANDLPLSDTESIL